MARAKWYELDNNAKIVPSTTKGSDTRVFRITCELKEEVNGALLQHALDRTVPDFPHFASVLRKGLFWYYLDSSNIHAVVQQENKPACAPIYWDGRRRLLYRVNYYRRRINLEMFHVLTDGTGALDFLRAIVCNYLKLAHNLEEEIPQDVSSVTEKEDDAFNRYYSKRQRSRRNRKLSPPGLSSARERDEVSADAPDRRHGFRFQVSEGGQRPSFYGSSFMTALFMESITEECVCGKKASYRAERSCEPAAIIFRRTRHAIFSVINVAFTGQYDGTIESILEVVQASFRRQLTQDQISLSMHDYARLEHNIVIRPIPYLLKISWWQQSTESCRRVSQARFPTWERSPSRNLIVP